MQLKVIIETLNSFKVNYKSFFNTSGKDQLNKLISNIQIDISCHKCNKNIKIEDESGFAQCQQCEISFEMFKFEVHATSQLKCMTCNQE